MAGPEGLRLYFGSGLPLEVRENIFGYGFHLWMARPLDVVAHFELAYGMHPAFSTRRAVTAAQLSEQARRLVNFESYWEVIFEMRHVEVFPDGLARPVVWEDGPMRWMWPYRGSKEQWAVPGLPDYYEELPHDHEG